MPIRNPQSEIRNGPPGGGFFHSVELQRRRVSSWDEFPFSIPAIKSLKTLKLNPGVTFFVGENGSGKSTLLEAIAVKYGLNAEGGSRNFRFSTKQETSKLAEYLKLEGRCPPWPRDAFFFRAESYFNLATEIDRLDDDAFNPNITAPRVIEAFGRKSLHQQSHGESFFVLFSDRFRENGFYLLDEPEAALSPSRQMSALTLMHEFVTHGCQFIIATHSPILMAYPGATIYLFDEKGIRKQEYEKTEHYTVTRDFLMRREQMLEILLEDKPTRDE